MFLVGIGIVVLLDIEEYGEHDRAKQDMIQPYNLCSNMF